MNCAFEVQSHGLGTRCLRFDHAGCPTHSQDSLPVAGQLYGAGL